MAPTSCAAFLLPIADDPAETVDDGVISRGNLYRSPHFHAAPGQHLRRRDLPLSWPKFYVDDPEPGIFVEAVDGDARRWQYLNYAYR